MNFEKFEYLYFLAYDEEISSIYITGSVEKYFALRFFLLYSRNLVLSDEAFQKGQKTFSTCAVKANQWKIIDQANQTCEGVRKEISKNL